MSDNKSSDYLEGNYDGKNMVSLVGQIEADIKEAIVISQKAEKKKEEAEENEAKRILGKESVTEEDIDKILEDYATNEEYKQYLMDGAVLQCNQATLEPFILPDGTQIDLVLNADENGEERKQTNLHVLDESMSANDTPYATVLDTEKEENIFPFRCHCNKGVDREEEYTKIKNDPSCKTDGVCKHLMMLSNEWDNLPLEGQFYKKRDVTIKITDDLNLIMKDTQCINMMSMLFCKHGGLITPVTSGQSNIQVTGVSEDLIDLLKKYETGMDKNGNYLKEGEAALYTYHSPSDATSVLTIGWGHAMRSFNDGWFVFSNGTNMNLYDMCIYDKSGKTKIKPVNSISKAQAEEILQSDIKEREKTLNAALATKQIDTMIDQRFYDALFSLTYQVGTKYLTNNSDLSNFLDKSKFDPSNDQEIKEQFGEYTNSLELGTMRRRADELDIIFYGTYDRDYNEKRYGDIWRKKTYPNITTPGY